MRKIWLALLLFAGMNEVKGQPGVTPPVNSEVCPGQPVILSISTGSNSPTAYTIVPNTLSGVTINGNIFGSTSPGTATVTFSDKKETHKFFIYYSGGGGFTYPYEYTKIKTLDGLKPAWPPGTPGVFPSGVYDDVILGSPITPQIAPCASANSFSYAAPGVKYKDASGTEFGSYMAFCVWLAPKGWKINSSVSDGVTPIFISGRQPTITPDPISTGEIKYRARNNCDVNALKPSDWYRIKIDRDPLILMADNQGQINVTCGQIATKHFSLQNLSQFSSCIVGGSFTWSFGSSPHGWKYNGSPVGSPVNNGTAEIDLEFDGSSSAPSDITVQFTGNNGSTYTYTISSNFTACVESNFYMTPRPTYTSCGIATERIFTVNEGAVSPAATSYLWTLGAQPNGWTYLGLPAPATITTNDPTLTVTNVASLTTGPSDVTVQPIINGVSLPFSYTSISYFVPCCSTVPYGLTSDQGFGGNSTLSWQTPDGGSYIIEIQSSYANYTSTSGTKSFGFYYGTGAVTGQFRVKTLCVNGLISDWSQWQSFSFSAPAPPNSNCVATLNYAYPVGGNQVYVSWNPSSAAITYDIRLDACCGSGTGTVTRTGYTGASATVLALSIPNPSSYFVYVRPVCSSGPGAWSAQTSPVTNVYRGADSIARTQVILRIDESQDAANKFTVYPNPATTFIAFEYNSVTRSAYQLRLIDNMGKIVMSRDLLINPGKNRFQFDLPAISNGVYILELADSKSKQQRKIVIAK